MSSVSKSIRNARTGADWEFMYHDRVFGEGRICPTRCWPNPSGGAPLCAEELPSARTANSNSARAYAPGCDSGDKVMSIEAEAYRNWENLVGNLNAAASNNAIKEPDYGYGSVEAAPKSAERFYIGEHPEGDSDAQERFKWGFRKPQPFQRQSLSDSTNAQGQSTRTGSSTNTAPAQSRITLMERFHDHHEVAEGAPGQAEHGATERYIGDRPMNRFSPAGEACGIAGPVGEEVSNPFRNQITHCRLGLYPSTNSDVQVPFAEHQSCTALALQSAFPGKSIGELGRDDRTVHLPAYAQSLCYSRRNNGCRCDSTASYPSAAADIRQIKE